MNFFLASWLYSDWLWLQGKAHFRGMLLMAWFTRRWYESREQRDAINAKVMADPRLKDSMSDMPFDGKRMIYGGFETFLVL
jgi:uncharacterized protein YbaA (DUF1428 family)